MKPRFANADCKIMAGQQTISSDDKHLSGQTFGLPVILTGHVKKGLEKKHFFTPLHFKRTSIFLLFMFLFVGLVRSSYYPFIFNINFWVVRRETRHENFCGQSTWPATVPNLFWTLQCLQPFMQTFLRVRHVFLTNAWRTPKNVCFGGYSMQTSAKEIKKFETKYSSFIFILYFVNHSPHPIQ